MDLDDDMFKHLTDKLEQALGDDDDLEDGPTVMDIEDSIETVKPNVQDGNPLDGNPLDGNPLNNLISQLFQGDMMSNLMKQMGQQVKENVLDVPNENEVEDKLNIPERDIKLSDCSDSVDSADEYSTNDDVFRPVFKSNSLLFCDVFVLNADTLISIHIDNAAEGYFRVVFNFGTNIISSSIYSNIYIKDVRCGLSELSRR